MILKYKKLIINYLQMLKIRILVYIKNKKKISSLNFNQTLMTSDKKKKG